MGPRRPIRIAGLLLVWFLLLPAYARQPRTWLSTPTRTPIQLTGTLAPLRTHFNEHRNLPRAVVLLSPT